MLCQLTSIDDLAEKVTSAVKVLGVAVPASVLELMFALGDGLLGAFGHGHHDVRVFTHQTPLLAPQSGVHIGVQVRVGDRVLLDRVGHQVARFTCSCDSPVFQKKIQFN